MKHVLALAFSLAFAAGRAEAGLYVTVSGSTETSSANFQSYTTNYGSASFGFDLGRYIRLSFTHSQQLSITGGHQNPEGQSGATSPAGNEDPTDDDQLIEFTNQTHVIGNSADLQLILYEGEVFVPYVTGGMILKTYRFVSHEEGQADDVTKAGPIPAPNLGAGLGIALNKEFMLKLQYMASPGLRREPGDAESRSVWDKKSTVGITYKI